MRTRLLVCCLVGLTFVLPGCGYKERKGVLHDGHPFSQPLQKVEPRPVRPLPPVPKEEPIVRIISGS